MSICPWLQCACLFLEGFCSNLQPAAPSPSFFVLAPAACSPCSLQPLQWKEAWTERAYQQLKGPGRIGPRTTNHYHYKCLIVPKHVLDEHIQDLSQRQWQGWTMPKIQDLRMMAVTLTNQILIKLFGILECTATPSQTLRLRLLFQYL